MTYRHTVHLHGDYIDGHLTSDQTSAIDNHLSVCNDCLADLQALRSLKNALSSVIVPDPGDQYFAGLDATVASLTQSPPPERIVTIDYPGAALSRTLKTLIRLAVVVTLLFTAFYISNIRQENLARQNPAAPVTGRYAGASGDPLGSQSQTDGRIKAVGAPPSDSTMQPTDSIRRTKP